MRTGLAFVLALALGASILASDDQGKGEDMTELSAQQALEAADDVFQTRDYAAARDKYLEVLELAREEFHRSVETEALAQVARMNLILGDKEAGRQWLDQAAEKANESDALGWSRFLGVRGRFEWKDDDLPTARATFEQMYRYCQENELWGRAIDAAHMIAIVAETPEEQIEWGRMGIEAAEKGEIESWLGPLWNNLAITYHDEKQFDSALSCFLKAREYHWRHSGEMGKLYADYHVGMTYRHLGRFDEAAQWLRPVLAWAERVEDHGAIGQACEDLGEIAIAQGRADEGKALLTRARNEYKAAGYDQSWTEVWEHINQRLDELP